MSTNPNWQDPHQYRDPHSDPSSVGPQIYIEYYYKRALVEAAKEAYFGQLADVTTMPKHFGKTIKLFHYLPILDDRNINDQGIDAEGVSTQAGFIANTTIAKQTISATAPASEGGMTYYFEGAATGATAGAAETAAAAIAETNLSVFWHQYYAGTKLTARADMITAGWTIEDIPASAGDANYQYGNLYGSSKDVGTIVGKLPALSETGGRVNRVGMKRLTIEGTISKFGFFEEYTQESLDFDNDMELESHITTEAVKAANEMTEDQIQIDLLNGAGVVRYAGNATSTGTIGGGTNPGDVDSVEYDDLVKLGIELDNNRTPKNTRLVTGSRMIDTKVIPSARYIYCGSELLPTLMKMTDYHGEKAWIPIEQYGAATQLARGEAGSVAGFRVIIVPEMMHWAGAGATANAADLAYTSSDPAGVEKVTVFPMLVVGDGSFTTIGFQTDGKTVKFRIKHVKPGSDGSFSRDDPYGTTGYYSCQWWYGLMVLRPERLAVIKTAALM